MACTFSTSQLPKVVRDRQFLTLLTSKCASRHNGVHFFDTFSTSQLPKVVRDRQFLTLLTSKCASRHNGVHFFDIATSKSGPNLVCFVHFDFEMCFAPQRRAFFSTSQLPKVVRGWGVLYILTWKCASRHNGVQFFIAPVASWVRTRRFSEPTFRPSGATNHWKNTVFRDFPIAFRASVSSVLLLFLFWSTWKCASRHNGVQRLRCFAHFDLEMRFAPQRRAIFHRSCGQLGPHPPL